MEIDFLPAELARWDNTQGDLFAICLWADVRPLRGTAGLLDWRLNGKLSRWMKAGRMSGAPSEKTLVPTTRIRWRTVLALGLGPAAAFSETVYRDALACAFATMKGLGLRTIAMALPGRDNNGITPERALTLLLEVGQAEPAITHFTIIDDAPTLRLMSAALVPAITKIPPIATHIHT
jgi:hypothetical protein